ncbi:MAG: hypothetical protein P1U63_12555 [Coxiellaceae bacterium]|nr:hypothetical protein [Coxiellaceae bacterium]
MREYRFEDFAKQVIPERSLKSDYPKLDFLTKDAVLKIMGTPRHQFSGRFPVGLTIKNDQGDVTRYAQVLQSLKNNQRAHSYNIIIDIFTKPIKPKFNSHRGKYKKPPYRNIDITDDTFNIDADLRRSFHSDHTLQGWCSHTILRILEFSFSHECLNVQRIMATLIPIYSATRLAHLLKVPLPAGNMTRLFDTETLQINLRLLIEERQQIKNAYNHYTAKIKKSPISTNRFHLTKTEEKQDTLRHILIGCEYLIAQYVVLATQLLSNPATSRSATRFTPHTMKALQAYIKTGANRAVATEDQLKLILRAKTRTAVSTSAFSRIRLRLWKHSPPPESLKQKLLDASCDETVDTTSLGSTAKC